MGAVVSTCMQMGGERPPLRLVGVVHELLEGAVVSTCMQMGGERPLLRLVGVVHELLEGAVVSTCMHELLEGDDILAGDGGLDFRLAPLCHQVLRTHARTGARAQHAMWPLWPSWVPVPSGVPLSAAECS